MHEDERKQTNTVTDRAKVHAKVYLVFSNIHFLRRIYCEDEGWVRHA